ncbi:MAG: ribonuclease E/G, partial [Bifidobacteriaceae bacterium]|nr:ribonuclease E/G [Bifidobacteriaceae bacterium]
MADDSQSQGSGAPESANRATSHTDGAATSAGQASQTAPDASAAPAAPAAPPAPSPASMAPRRRSRGRRVVRGAGETTSTVMPGSSRKHAHAASEADGDAAASNPAPHTAPHSAPSPADDARAVRIAALASEIFSDPGIHAPSGAASDVVTASGTEKTGENASASTRRRTRRTRGTAEAPVESRGESTTGRRSRRGDGLRDDDREESREESREDARAARRARRRSLVADSSDAERSARRDDPRAQDSRAQDSHDYHERDFRDDQDLQGEGASARARRARRAVSQILEFSNPEAAVASRRSDSKSRPMMSLLFQEPVAQPQGDDRDETAHDRGNGSRDDDSADSQRSVRTRRRRRAAAADDARSDRADRSDYADRSDRSSRGNRDDAANEGADEFDEPRRSRRSRRLNAQERRAAAEVEHIEEDLQYDDIHYTPVESEPQRDGDRTSDRDADRAADRDTDRAGEGRDREDSADSTLTTRTRRRRRRHEDDADEAEEQTVTRRRRRRHSGKGEDEKEVIPRSRKQQYIDEITDIEGSTRLEAKKQRRRDNRRDRSRQSLITEQDFLARRESVNRLMVVREKERHTQISVIEDNTLVEHYISDIQEVSAVGNIYLGRVQNVLPSMEAAFVDIGQARNGVLYAGEVNWDTTRLEGQPRRIELAFKSGDPVLVQVTKDPIGHKGARLTSQVTLAGRFLVLVPSGGMTGVSRKLPAHERARLKSIVSKIAPKDMGVIIRTAAEGAPEEAIVKDLQHLQKQWDDITAKQKEYQHSRKPHLLQGEPDVAIRVVRDIFNDDFSKLVVEGDRVYDRIRQYLESTAPDLLDRLEKWNPEDHNGKDVFDKWSIDSQLRKGMER